jgi:beta-N-acetylhexosaminidase
MNIRDVLGAARLPAPPWRGTARATLRGPVRLAVRRASAALLGAALVMPIPGSSFLQVASAASPTTAHLIGQKLMVAMSGTTPTSSLLGRIQRGEIGGVILFGANITSATQLRSLTTKLRQAAVAGGQPPLLIATDQEGGTVKRLSWAAPTISPPAMGASGSTSTAFAQGKATGVALECAGINNDLAPVADVPSSTSSFMYQQGRTWSFSASTTAALSDAFASGLEAGSTVPAMKHFPGIGRAAYNTDTTVDTITASASTLAPGLLPYQKAIANGIPMIMLSNATYTAYDSANAAGWSHAINFDLLRTNLGFKGVTITDSLTGTAKSRGVTATSLAIKAAASGTDMLMLTGSESSTAATYAALVSAAQGGSISATRLQSSYSRILTLKMSLASPTADSSAPSLHAPVSRLYSLSTLGTTTAGTTPVRTSWSVSDGCGISSVTLERRVGSSAWSVQSSGAPATSVNQSLRLGSTYRYTVKATDGAGNTSGFVAGAAFEPLLSEQTSGAITYHGTWTPVANSYASGGTLRYSTASGASASYTFTGTSVSWVAYRGANRGQAAVYLDGVYQQTVNLYSTSYWARQIVYAATWSTSGTHTLRIVNLGTSGHSRVDVDAFVRLIAR